MKSQGELILIGIGVTLARGVIFLVEAFGYYLAGRMVAGWFGV